MTRRIIAAVFALCLALCSCSVVTQDPVVTTDTGLAAGTSLSSDTPDTAEVSIESSDATGEESDVSPVSSVGSIRDIADAAAATGHFGDTMELLVKGDDYAEDLLMFSFGLEEYEEMHVEDYIVSEQKSKLAYSFALAVLSSDSSAADVDSVQFILGDTYVSGLKTSLEVYNPDAYKMAGDAAVTVLESETTGKKAVLLVISDDNEAVNDALIPLVNDFIG